MRLPIDVDMMPATLNCDNLEEEKLDGTLRLLLAKREEIFDKVEKNISSAQQKQKVACFVYCWHHRSPLSCHPSQQMFACIITYYSLSLFGLYDLYVQCIKYHDITVCDIHDWLKPHD